MQDHLYEWNKNKEVDVVEIEPKEELTLEEKVKQLERRVSELEKNHMEQLRREQALLQTRLLAHNLYEQQNCQVNQVFANFPNVQPSYLQHQQINTCQGSHFHL